MGNSASFPSENTGPSRNRGNRVTCCAQSYRCIYASAIAVMVLNLVFTPLLFGLSFVSPACAIVAVILMITLSSYIYTQSKNLGGRMNAHLNNSQLAFSIIAAIFGIIAGSCLLYGYSAMLNCYTIIYSNRYWGGYYSYYGTSSSTDPSSCLVAYAYSYSYGSATYAQYMNMLTFYYGVIIMGVNFLFITLQVILFSCTCAQVWKEAIRQANNENSDDSVRNIVVPEKGHAFHGSPAHGSTIQNTAQFSPAQPLHTSPMSGQQQYTPQYPQMPMPTASGQQNVMYPPVYSAPQSDPPNVPIEAWSKNDVCKWLEQEQLETMAATFRTNSIDGLAMSSLTQGELQQMNLPIGRVKKFLSARERLLSRKVHPTQNF